MSTSLIVQSNFSHGELDPRVFNVSLDVYYKSAKYLRNVYVRPQGGVTKRHGSIFHVELNSSAAETKLGAFTHDTNNSYLLVWIDGQLKIYKDIDGKLKEISNVVSPYTASQVRQVRDAQVGQTLYRAHLEVPVNQLTRGADDSTWTLAPVEYQNAPIHDFDNTFINSTFTLADTSIGKDRVLTTDIDTFSEAYLGGIFSAQGLSSAVSEIIGMGRITSYNDPRSVNITIVNPFGDSLNDGVKGNHCFLAEPLYSVARGYPGAIGMSQSSLCLGGSLQAPNVFVKSKINVPLNFNVIDSSDSDSALSYVLEGKNHNIIEWIESNQSIQIFGSNDTFSTTSSLVDANNTKMSLQTSKGASTKCSPQTLDNSVFYVQSGGKAVMKHVFNPQSATYTSIPVSELAAHLIKNPIASAVLSGDELDSADYLFLINEDGTMVVLQSLEIQNVLGWSLCGTGSDLVMSDMMPAQGKYKDIVAVNNKMYVLVERIINEDEVKLYIEELSFNVKTDCTIIQNYQENVTVVRNLEKLEGLKVKIVADGFILADQTISNGEITIERPSSNISIGIKYELLLTPLPVNILGSHTKYLPKRIVKTWVSYYESLGIMVNGVLIPDLYWNNHILNKIPDPKSDWYEEQVGNWDPKKTYDITQDQPLPFSVLGLGYKVEF